MKTLRQQGKAGLRQWSRLFLSRGCSVCDRPTTQTFCPDCQRQVLPVAIPQAVQAWAQNETHTLPISALGPYGGALKRAIFAMKYSDRPEVAVPLGHALAQQWLSQPLSANGSLAAVPIPLHAQRQAMRGYNQAELLAKAFCQASGLPLLTDGLIRTHATQPQHQLSSTARQRNLAEAFQLGPALQRSERPVARTRPKPSILLIDDIYTTGATARAAATALEQAGISVVGMLAVARAILS